MNKNQNRNLQIGFGVSLLLLVVSSISSYYAINNLLRSADLADHSTLVTEKLDDILSTMKDAETGQRGFLLTNRKEFLEPYTGSAERSLILTEEVKDLTADNPTQQHNIDAIKDVLLNRLSILKDMLAKKDSGKTVTVDDLGTGKKAMDALRVAVKKARDDERALLESREATLKKFTSFTPLIIIFAAVLAIGFSLFSFFRVTADMSERARLLRELELKDEEMRRRIGIIQRIAEQISGGDYTTRVDDHEQDDLGGLSVSLNKMAESLSYSFNKLADNEWLQTGAAKLNDLMIGEKTMTILADDILQFIVEYTNSQAAAMYIVENEALVLQGGFALSGAKKTIRPGDGLVGQCFLSGQSFWLQELSDEQLHISHASGEIKPQNILIVPVHHEKEVIGVLELASVKPYPERKLHFLKNVEGNVGVAMHSAQNRRRMQELLEETQAQTEELQVQHNELEGMNTELEAHTQKLQTSEEELRVQQEELQQTNQELAERNLQVRQRNEEIQTKAAELEQTTRYKSEFMANMSHELRTPLNSILLLSRYLAENSDNNLNGDQVESANVILNSGKGLLNLIDELLDLSKIEAGKMELEYQKVSVSTILNNIQPLFQPIAKEKKLSFIVDTELAEDINFETDQMRLEQILKNLLSNALKFTSKGEVKLTVKQADKKSGLLEWTVSDTGIGISPEKQELVFDAFQQADGSTKRRFGGTGLGLSISRELARLLGGNIRLTSEPGKGSQFTLSLPQNRAAEQPKVKEEPMVRPPLEDNPVKERITGKFVVPLIPAAVDDDRNGLAEKDKVILIVEDDTNFAKALLSFTRKNGYKGIVAVRGDDGITLAREFLPAAILLDIQLPVLDGWQVMEELKNNTLTRHIPVHMMSSLEAKRESRIKGAVDFINKPVAMEQMKEMFKKLEDVWAKHPKKILIVEENTRHAQALAYFLESYNVNTAIASDVKDSVEALQKKEIDCVIMDMGVPNKLGYNSLDAIKQHAGFEDLPIIVFTGKHLSAGEESKIRQYADTIVVKTAHSYQRLIDEVTLFLHLVEQQKTDDGAAVAKRAAPLKEVLAGKTLLIADDDVRNIFSMTKSLEQYGLNVLSATDGKEAIEALNAHPETAIVLMDMMMPEMDGYESTAKIRLDARFADIPIIAVTAKAMLGDREKCIRAGASDYISKPVDIDQLTSLLRVWLFNK